jgi:hypothetical protein
MNWSRWSIAWCVAYATLVPRASASPPAAASDPFADAMRIVRAYAAGDTLHAEPRPPTPAELEAVTMIGPIDLDIDQDRWREMNAATRLTAVYMHAHRRQWFARCDALVEAWWARAQRVDEELQARLARQAPPDEFYAGMKYWRAQALWLYERKHDDAALKALPALEAVGPSFRLYAAQNRWSVARFAREHPLEHVVSTFPMPANAWALEDLATERKRICEAAFANFSDLWIPTMNIGLVTPADAPSLGMVSDFGSVARIRKHATEWVVTRREWTEIRNDMACEVLTVRPPKGECHPVVSRHFTDHTFVLHFDAAPATPHLGDNVTFWLDPATGHAVLAVATRSGGAVPYFSLW